jgi:hypothetical protein
LYWYLPCTDSGRPRYTETGAALWARLKNSTVNFARELPESAKPKRSATSSIPDCRIAISSSYRCYERREGGYGKRFGVWRQVTKAERVDIFMLQLL